MATHCEFCCRMYISFAAWSCRIVIGQTTGDLFKKVTVDDITAFEKSCKGSEEEAETLRFAYVDFEGDMEKILEEVSVCVCVCPYEPGGQQWQWHFP